MRAAGHRIDDEADDRVGARRQIQLYPGFLATRLQCGVADVDELRDERRTGRWRSGHHAGELGHDVVRRDAIWNSPEDRVMSVHLAGVVDLPDLRTTGDGVAAHGVLEAVGLL